VSCGVEASSTPDRCMNVCTIHRDGHVRCDGKRFDHCYPLAHPPIHPFVAECVVPPVIEAVAASRLCPRTVLLHPFAYVRDVPPHVRSLACWSS